MDAKVFRDLPEHFSITAALPRRLPKNGNISDRARERPLDVLVDQGLDISKLALY